MAGMSYTAEEVSDWLVDLGLEVTVVCGVRAFADFVSSERLDDPEFFEALLNLELAAADRPPYNRVARYGQVIAHKRCVVD